jgi:hypothetical protein
MHQQIKEFLNSIQGLKISHTYATKTAHYFHFTATPDALLKICEFSHRTNVIVQVYLRGWLKTLAYMLIVGAKEIHVLEDIKMHFKRAKEENNVQLDAYLLWEKAGKPEGMSDYFWKMAERQGSGAKEPEPEKSTSYCCSACGKTCYYDGRCGDGPIRTCNCWNGTASTQKEWS